MSLNTSVSDISPSMHEKLARAGQALDYLRATLANVGAGRPNSRAELVSKFDRLMFQASETATANENVARRIEQTGIADVVLLALTNFFGESTLVTDWSNDAPCTESEKSEMLLLTEAYALMITSIVTAITMEMTRQEQLGEPGLDLDQTNG